jgi:hypothetical protein
MSTTLKQSFTPVRVGRYTLPNRLVMAPMTRNRAKYDAGGSGCRTLCAACEHQPDRHRRHSTLRRRTGLSCDAGDIHSRAYRWMAESD